jgi:hypothetical protein
MDEFVELGQQVFSGCRIETSGNRRLSNHDLRGT